MRLSFQASAWRLKRHLAELMPGKAKLFPAVVSLRKTPRAKGAWKIGGWVSIWAMVVL